MVTREEPLTRVDIQEITDILRRLDEKGKIQLVDMSIDQPAEANTYDHDTGSLHEISLLYLILCPVILAYAAVYLLPPGDGLVPIRWALGTLLVMFFPGYVTVQALFPTRDLEAVERYAFSFASSFAIIPIIAFVLNYTPWGVRLDPVVTALVLYTVCVALIASYRKHRRRPSH